MAKRPNGAGSLYRRNGWYYAQLKVAGKFMRRALDTRDRREAEKRLNALAVGFDLSDEERLAALAVRLKPKSARRSFDEAWSAYERAPENLGQSARARAEDKSVWETFVERLGAKSAAYLLDDVTEEIAAEFVEHLKGIRSAHTVNKYIRILKRIWTLNRVADNPWSAFRKLKVEPVQRRALSRVEVDFLIEKAEGELRTLFVLGAYTGMRLSDCQRFRWEMVSGDRLMVRTTKTKRLAVIPAHPVLKAEIGPPKKSGYVMPELASWPKWKISNHVQRHFIACGFATQSKRPGNYKASVEIGFHSLRSTFITRLGEAGVPLAVVREMVGHVSEEMSQRYFRADADMAAKAIAALG